MPGYTPLNEYDPTTKSGGESWWNLPAKLNVIFAYLEALANTLVGKVTKSITTDIDGKGQLVNDLADSEVIPNLVYGVDDTGVRGFKVDLGGKIGTVEVDDTGVLDGFILYYDATSGKWKVRAESGLVGRSFLILPYAIYRNFTGSGLTGYLDVQMEISTDPLFGTPFYSLDSGASPAGWISFSVADGAFHSWNSIGEPATDVLGIAYDGTLFFSSGVRYYMRWRGYEHGETPGGDWMPGGVL